VQLKTRMTPAASADVVETSWLARRYCSGFGGRPATTPWAPSVADQISLSQRDDTQS